MAISAVICEFNPFHNGHKYLLEQMKKEGAYVVCVMSGNFVQRGDFALCDKYIRAEAAVKCGADLVIELPLPYALGSAETFARGSIDIIDRLKIVDRLYFGSESSLDELKYTLKKTRTEAFINELSVLMKSGISYPDAFFEALGKNCLCGGNDILALEYLKRLEDIASAVEPVAVKRKGSGHNSDAYCGEYASASYIRKLIKNNEDAESFMPFDVPFGEISEPEKLSLAALSKFRQMSQSDFARIADVNEGLEFRLKKAVLDAESLDDLFERVRTKRYTLSKIRRVLLCSYLGVTKQMQTEAVGFVNVLALSKNGSEILSLIKQSSTLIPIIRYSDTEALCESDRSLYEFTVKSDDLFGLTLPNVRPAYYDMRRKFTVTK